MKLLVIAVLLATVLVDCKHTFLGTNVLRSMVYHHDAQFGAKFLQKRVEYINFTLAPVPANLGRSIQGILAYDVDNTGASCNVTEGGIGSNTVNLRMKSDRGKGLHYDIYIYA